MSEEEKDMSFLDHLEELRSKLFRSIIAIAIFAVVLFIFKDILLNVLFGPANLDFITYKLWCKLSYFLELGDKLCINEIPYTLQSTKMAGPFFAHLTASLIGGVILAFPYIFYQVWLFIKPGLRSTETSAVRGIVFYVSLLFFLGIMFGYFFLAPLSTMFLGGYDFGVENRPDLRTYTKLVSGLTIATGIMFQLPVFVFFLTKAGLVTPAILKKYRRHALVAVLILSAIITPPDVSSQLLVAFPVLLLYEISILVSKRVIRKAKSD